MSNLENIKKALKKLEDNGAITQKEIVRTYLPYTDPDGYGQKVNLWVAPKEGIYTPTGLQEFMETLLPDYKPNKVKNFYKEGGVMILGRLSYVERIKDLKRVMTTSDHEAFKDDEELKSVGFDKDKIELPEEGIQHIDRLILVRPVPNELALDDIISKRLTHEDLIDMKQVRLYQKMRLYPAKYA